VSEAFANFEIYVLNTKMMSINLLRIVHTVECAAAISALF